MKKTLKIIGYSILTLIFFYPLLVILLSTVISFFPTLAEGWGGVIWPVTISIPIALILAISLAIAKVNNHSSIKINTISRYLYKYLPTRKFLLGVACIFILLLLGILWQTISSGS